MSNFQITPLHRLNKLVFFGRCQKNDSWLRGRVLEMTQEGVRVFYVDCGRIEVHNEAQRLADMPPDLCSRRGVLQCTLDPTSTWSRFFSSSVCFYLENAETHIAAC